MQLFSRISRLQPDRFRSHRAVTRLKERRGVPQSLRVAIHRKQAHRERASQKSWRGCLVAFNVLQAPSHVFTKVDAEGVKKITRFDGSYTKIIQTVSRPQPDLCQPILPPMSGPVSHSVSESRVWLPLICWLSMPCPGPKL